MVKPDELLQRFIKLYPNAPKLVEQKFIERDANLPKHLFLDFEDFKDVGHELFADLEDDLDAFASANNYLFSFMSWHYMRGVYTIQNELFDSILNSKIPNELPIQSVMQLPQQCVFIQLPRVIKVTSFHKDGEAFTEIHGFFCSIQNMESTPSLELLLIAENIDAPMMLPISVSLIKGSLKECLLHMREQEINSIKKARDNASSMEYIMHYNKLLEFHSNAIELIDKDVEQVERFVKILLFMCQDQPVITNAKEPEYLPKNPTLKKTKKGVRLFVPDKTRYFELGKQFADEIKKYQSHGEGLGSKKPHYRSGHYRLQWKGKRGSQWCEYRWINPVFVNACESIEKE